jgi:uncharacterized protein (TIGR02246 family)
MPARKPEDLDKLFGEALNAGNLDAMVALYEQGASIATEPGKFVSGTAAVREALKGFVALKPKIALNVRRVISSGDIALVHADWSLTGTGPDGKPVKMEGRSAEVVRRQRDGTWLFIIDNPNALI